MDGMTEACVKGGIEACYTSVSCACALLSALDELLQGRGIQPEQVGALLSCCLFTCDVRSALSSGVLTFSLLYVRWTGSASTQTQGRPEGRD